MAFRSRGNRRAKNFLLTRGGGTIGGVGAKAGGVPGAKINGSETSFLHGSVVFRARARSFAETFGLRTRKKKTVAFGAASSETYSRVFRAVFR